MVDQVVLHLVTAFERDSWWDMARVVNSIVEKRKCWPTMGHLLSSLLARILFCREYGWFTCLCSDCKSMRKYRKQNNQIHGIASSLENICGYVVSLHPAPLHHSSDENSALKSKGLCYPRKMHQFISGGNHVTRCSQCLMKHNEAGVCQLALDV